jgi:prepilin-type N-terminal cleavage/methylation domain-containing protein|tara:strand:- start:910 stop:1407 length:498 start_codon:yes stop_codon:yes gene_type:complete
MVHKLRKTTKKATSGFTLVEVMVVLILLALSFMVFLQALNTGKSVRVKSEIRTVQSVILNSLANQIRARRFDENSSEPWSSSLGKESGETSISQFDDIDDFHQYSLSAVPDQPAFSCSVAVQYVNVASGFHTPQSQQTNFKSVMVKVSHKTLPAITDTMIISPGL